MRYDLLRVLLSNLKSKGGTVCYCSCRHNRQQIGSSNASVSALTTVILSLKELILWHAQRQEKNRKASNFKFWEFCRRPLDVILIVCVFNRGYDKRP